MGTVIKVLGVIALIWIAFMIIGVLFKVLFWVLVIGGAVFLGSMAYAAIKDRSNRNALPR